MKHVMNHYNKNKDNDEYREKHRQTDAYKQYCEERKKDEKVQERKRIVDREWKKNNPEKVKEHARKSYKTYYAKHGQTEEYKEKRRLNRVKYENKERRNNDIIVRLRDSVLRRINKALKSRNSSKSDRTIEYLGCSIDILVEHLEKQFKDGMSWDNYGRKSGKICWEIDHKIPINYGDPDLDEVKKRLHYTNCQPMWAEENRSKSNKYIG